MENLARTAAVERRLLAAPAKEMYFSLLDEEPGNTVLLEAAAFLQDNLKEARKLPNELPARLDELNDWMLAKAARVGEDYRRYLETRKAGGKPIYFSSRSHALHFIQSAAPTKLVDGAWLYGMLSQWESPECHDLIRTYLEELGDGVTDKNHVVLYKKLLATHGCDHWEQLSDEHFTQGALQLCLAYQADHFLPEVIGYNLGYEQLPLHLLITAYELNELGIDPYYFTLHTTIDNAATGHAHKALTSIKQLMPVVGDRSDFYQRVIDGYRLNDLGANTISIIRSFDLYDEVIKMFQQKAVVGQNMHSNYCRVAGRTVNDWLSKPDNIPGFLQALIEAQWITPGAAAENSRFWHLIQGERSEMFGVFSDYEQQLLRDWIESSALNQEPANDNVRTAAPRRDASFRAKQRSLTAMASNNDRFIERQQIGRQRPIIRTHHSQEESDDFSVELRSLETKIASLESRRAVMQSLLQLMSPAQHHTRAGLMATRIFSKMLG